MEALPLLFFSQKMLLDGFFFVCSVPKAVGPDLAARPTAIVSG